MRTYLRSSDKWISLYADVDEKALYTADGRRYPDPFGAWFEAWYTHYNRRDYREWLPEQ